MTTNLLFHRRTLGKAIECYDFPDDLLTLQARILQWLEPLRSGVLDEVKEVSLHGQFLGDIFGRVLGYRSIIDGSTPLTASGGNWSWEIHAEQSISDGGGTADAAIGLFTAVSGKSGKQKLAGKIIAPIELKGAKNDLDRPAPGRKESAVDQGWRYANYTPDCKWVIVSNYREIRLYNLSKTPAYYEQFYLSDLADIEQFKQFYFLLCRDNFIPAVAGSISAIDLLLSASNQAEEEITDRLYREYKHVRLELTQHFSNSDPKIGVEIAIEKAQKTLDRILFITFCEDRGLLPARTIEQAHDHRDPYHPERKIWDNYQSIFRSVDKGNDALKIPSYNGGLFKSDPILDKQLKVSDALCTQLKNLTRFDFETEVSVNILGHIFEQSITDLEELRATAAGEKFDVSKGKRKTQGVYYTPAYITQYIVDVALGGYLRRQEAALREEYSLDNLPIRVTKKRQQIEVKFWEAYREIIVQTRVIDPACGSGAFLIAAFEYLSREYERVNAALAELKSGQRSVFDLNKTILNNNLYGVDLSPESVEITKLSLWLKTAERGKPLTDLNDNIKAGNSIVNDPSIDARAFDWEAAFPDIFAAGGFDVVIGNPPYVRQELLTPIKPYLQQHYQSYDGVADLYTYFYERGIELLKPDGVMSYIVTNKWFKAGYGENLRRFFVEHTIFEQIVDFGHAPIFQDADTFPCIVSVRKPLTPLSTDLPILICPVPREKLVDINLAQYVQSEGYHVPTSRFTSDAWSIEHPDVETLMQKIKAVGVPLKEFVGVKPYYGIKTGFNEAFLIDNATRDRIVQADPKSAEIIKPYLRGQDVKRWHSEWQNIWIILIKSSANYSWNWSKCELNEAEEIFRSTYPGVYNHFKLLEDKLSKRSDRGKFWWELRQCSYYNIFKSPKIFYQVIQTFPQYSFSQETIYGNDKTFILPTDDLYLLALLNSPVIWYYSHRIFTQMLSDSISPMGYLFETLPIAPPDAKLRVEVESIASRSIELTKANQSSYRDIYDWLQLEHQIEKLGRKLEDFSSLSLEEFVQEIKKRKSKDDRGLTPQSLKEIKAAYQEYAPQIQTRKSEILQLEHQLSDLVNRAYQLTPAEIELMWRTAPPRMPITRNYAP